MNPGVKIYKDVQQGSEQWERMRAGRPTASNADRVITAAKGNYSKGAEGYIAELIGALMAPDEPVKFTGSFATEHGNESEPKARAAFQKLTGLKLTQVGFITGYNDIVGLSPDALILSDDEMDYIGGLELKCPLRKQHVLNHAAGGLPDDYKQQIHWSLAVTGLPRWHFYSWHPDMKSVHHIVYPDAYTLKVRAAIEQFLIEYADLRARLIPQLALTQPAE